MNDPLLRAFLDDIKSNPFDPAPRLILADWLDEQATTEAEHARAALLRLSVVEQQTPAPLNRLVGNEARTIWGRFQKTWTEPIQHISGIRVTCAQGLIHLEVTVSGWMSRAMRLFAESPNWLWVSGLTVTGRDQRLDRVWQRPWLRSLARLRLRCGRSFMTGRWESLFDSPNLEGLSELELQGQIRSLHGLPQLARWPGLSRLRVLNLANNALDEGEVRPLLASRLLLDLRKLDLTNCSLNDATFQTLVQHREFAGLEDLQVSQNHLTARAISALDLAPLTKTLRHLTLNQNPLDNEGIERLARLDLPSLKSLQILASSIGPGGGEALAQAPWRSNLEFLELSNNPMNSGGLALLRTPLPALRSLSLRNIGLTDEAAPVLQEARSLTRLQCLDLGNNPHIGDVATALTRNSALEELRWLDLGHCMISDIGASALSRWPCLLRLEMLGLEYNNLHDVGLRALLETPGRRPSAIWRLHGNQVSPRLCQEMRLSAQPIVF